MKIAIQGEPGSFSHEAARRMVKGCTIVPCARSFEVFDLLGSGKVPVAVIPIENSLAGSVTEHLDLLLARDVFIQRDFHLRIVHNLIAPRGVKQSDLRRVFSHPVALDQCRDFFRGNPKIQPNPFYDTAGAVKQPLSYGPGQRVSGCRNGLSLQRRIVADNLVLRAAQTCRGHASLRHRFASPPTPRAPRRQ